MSSWCTQQHEIATADTPVVASVVYLQSAADFGTTVLDAMLIPSARETIHQAVFTRQSMRLYGVAVAKTVSQKRLRAAPSDSDGASEVIQECSMS